MACNFHGVAQRVAAAQKVLDGRVGDGKIVWDFLEDLKKRMSEEARDYDDWGRSVPLAQEALRQVQSGSFASLSDDAVGVLTSNVKQLVDNPWMAGV
jgi:hypothetical protein